MSSSPHNVSTRTYLTTRSVFRVTIIVIIVTLLGVWLFGLGTHRTMYVNSLLSISILSYVFLTFLTTALYNGVKLKDDLGKITDKIDLKKMPSLSGFGDFVDMTDVGDGVIGVFFAIFSWILVSIILILLVFIFSTYFWAMILCFMAMLYWILFRALRLVFKNSNVCKGKLIKSFLYGLGYTLLYNFWMYGILLIAHHISI